MSANPSSVILKVLLPSTLGDGHLSLVTDLRKLKVHQLTATILEKGLSVFPCFLCICASMHPCTPQRSPVCV